MPEVKGIKQAGSTCLQKKQKPKNKKEKKKLRKKTAAEPEILGGFDCKGIGDRMMDEFQRPHKDETEENQ